MNEVYAFDVWVAGTDWHASINDRTAGRAKADYFRDVKESWPDIPFTAMRARKIGAPQSNVDFVRTAIYRGFERGAIKCGDRVRTGSGTGVIVGANSSANFDVLFDDDSPRYAGLKLNCHPASIEVIP